MTISEVDSEVLADSARLADAVSKAVVGQHSVIREVIVALLSGGHVLVEGVPGLGKTLLVRALAKTFGGSFRRIQFTPDLMPTDVIGHVLFNAKLQEFEVRHGPVFTHFLLADEINRAPAKTQSALLEVMQERQVTIEGQSDLVPVPFMVFATQNPIEQEGTYPLPEAQLDRFLIKALIDYPTEQDEIGMVHQVTTGNASEKLNVDQVETFLTPQRVSRMQAAAAEVFIDPRVLEYAVRIARKTRDHSAISIGAGPRGAIALVRAARSAALLDQRNFVVPDDVKSIAPAVLRHRIRLAPELEIEGGRPDDVLARILDETEAPRL
jgi:MoxR-like ATPase